MMFEIPPEKILDTDLPVIIDNFTVLHFDEYPILFFGTNAYGNKVLGSLMSEDEDEDVFRFIHVIVNNEIFWRFITQKISYRGLIERAGTAFILDKDINDNLLRIYHTAYNQIPPDFLPLHDVLCPDFIVRLGFDFSLSLKGGLAGMSEAFVKNAAIVTEAFEGLIRSALNSMRGLKLAPEIVQVPYTEGSFRINLKIKLPASSDLFITYEDISNYVGEYLNYCIEDLPDEVKGLLDEDPEIVSETKFRTLSENLRDIYIKSAIKYDITSEEQLRSDVFISLSKVEGISDEIGHGFNEVEVVGKTRSQDSEMPIAYINRGKSIEISNASDFILNATGGIEEDQHEREYDISIYHLNLSTRTGNAYIYSEIDEKIMDKPKIMILGDEELSGTPFTESLHMSRWIKVQGRAKRVKGKIKYITISGNLT